MSESGIAAVLKLVRSKKILSLCICAQKVAWDRRGRAQGARRGRTSASPNWLKLSVIIWVDDDLFFHTY